MRLGAQVLEAALDERRQVRAAIGLFGGRHDPCARPWWRCRSSRASLSSSLREQLFASAVSVHVGGVEEVDAFLDRAMERARANRRRSTSPQVPPIAHAPKLIEETLKPVRPRGRYSMGALSRRFHARQDRRSPLHRAEERGGGNR